MHSVAAVTNFMARRDWLTSSTSQLTHHGDCCAKARAWLVATSRSLDFASTDAFELAAPRWLTRRYAWGPTEWPIAWCEAVQAKAVDCGVFSAFAREVFQAKGLAVHGAQVLRHYAATSTSHWRAKWGGVPKAFNWIDDDILYHEVVVVEVGDAEVLVYDPTDGLWLDPDVTRGHGAHLAIRADLPASRSWGRHVITPKQWVGMDS
jgi:hypothetical protein